MSRRRQREQPRATHFAKASPTSATVQLASCAMRARAAADSDAVGCVRSSAESAEMTASCRLMVSNMLASPPAAATALLGSSDAKLERRRALRS